jgi:hypothetical protein
MKFTIVNLSEVNSKAKATVHTSGKLGFNSEAAELMKLIDDSSFMVAYDGEKGSFKNLYLLPESSEQSNTMKVQKSSGYYALPLAGVFNMLELDYVNYKIIFDVILDEHEGKTIYKLKKRPKDIKRTDKNETDED